MMKGQGHPCDAGQLLVENSSKRLVKHFRKKNFLVQKLGRLVPLAKEGEL